MHQNVQNLEIFCIQIKEEQNLKKTKKVIKKLTEISKIVAKEWKEITNDAKKKMGRTSKRIEIEIQ